MKFINDYDYIGKLKTQLYRFYPFNIAPGTIFLCSYPRSGNTWVRKILTHLMIEKDSNKNIIEAMQRYIPDIHNDEDRSYIRESNKFKLIKSHLPYNERYPKIVYIVRDFRSVVVSYFKVSVKLYGYNKSFDHFFKRELKGWGPYGSWASHVNSYLNNKQSDILFLKYEDMVKKPYENFKNILSFCNIEYEDKHLKQVIDKNAIKFYKRICEKETDVENITKTEVHNFIYNYQTNKYKKNLKDNYIRELKNSSFYNTIAKLGYW